MDTSFWFRTLERWLYVLRYPGGEGVLEDVSSMLGKGVVVPVGGWSRVLCLTFGYVEVWGGLVCFWVDGALGSLC